MNMQFKYNASENLKQREHARRNGTRGPLKGHVRVSPISEES